MTPKTFFHRRRGFTLIEVLVVVAIIALLISILLPSLARAREEARILVCKTRMREMFLGHTFYAATNKGVFPHWSWWLFDGVGHAEPKVARSAADLAAGYYPASYVYRSTGGVRSTDSSQWVRYGDIFQYVKNPAAYLCPADNLERYEGSLGGDVTGSQQGSKAIHSYIRLMDPHDGYHMRLGHDRIAPFTAYATEDGIKQCDFINPDKLRPGMFKSDVLPEVQNYYSVASRVVLMIEEYQGAANDTGNKSNVSLNDGHSGIYWAGTVLSGRHAKRGQLLYWDGHCELGDSARWNRFSPAGDIYAMNRALGGGGNPPKTRQ